MVHVSDPYDMEADSATAARKRELERDAEQLRVDQEVGLSQVEFS
jgi:hypothetical protein